jgi:glycosyltransferase involved in cell wall biosynthesis
MDMSIVVPTYNGSATLPRLLQSIKLAEHTKSYEILICDDGSSEDIAAVIALHGGDLPARVLRQDRMDARRAAARNLGIRASQGDVILFLDDDVAFSRTFLMSHVKSHQDTSASRLVFGFRHRVRLEPPGPWTSEVLLINDHRPSWIGRRGERLSESPIPWYHAFTCNLSVCRRGADLLFDESFVGWGCEDIDFAYRCWRGGVELHCDPDAMVVHLDQEILADPYVNRRYGKPASFTSVTLNTVRMLEKFPDDPVLQTWLRKTLTGFKVENGECISDSSANDVDSLIVWCLDRIAQKLDAP